eukprot:TRINITY_DN4257_c0_g1_i1.p1 TRINITY_DN4257_c0_g1~~TRINITY_DN4257_c0_g1_i1.p1  ORF type:complete len:124 (-),score=43.56 TRINITY_DN4257_c0_g1_i1:706-1077(-)
MSSSVDRLRNQEAVTLVAIIADEDTVTGFLLAGIGDRSHGKNYMIVNAETTKPQIEAAFHSFTQRDDISVLLISQKIADEIRNLLDAYNDLLPTILEIPDSSHPYEPEKDSVMTRINKILGVA